jgi:Ran GTPase-activating protein (RanGAP) involved in mRNA processing and transport
MLRRTSKGVKEGVDKMRPPTVAKLSRAFWNNARNGTAAEKLQHMLADLEKMASRCRITTLNLEGCGMSGQDAGRLWALLPQCPELSLLNLGGNRIGAAGAERLAGVLPQCPALAYLSLGYNRIGDAGAERLAGVLTQCAALVHLNLRENDIGTVWEERLRASWRGEASGLLL